MDEVLKAKEYENTSRSVGIPVSTRAVGISTTITYNKAVATEANRQRLPNTTIFQIYRVMLAMVERKVFDNRRVAKLDDREIWYDPVRFEEFKSTITSLNITTQQIGALIRCISNFKFEDVSFSPLFPAKQYDNNRRYIPVPEVVYLTNLRETVVSLSDQRVAVAVWRNFINKNPIPGAVFDGTILTNPNEIIPANYTAETLRDDLYAVKNWIEATSDLKNTREKWFTQIQLSDVTHGNESMLVSNKSSENLRLETANNVTSLHGDISSYWYRSKMSDQMIFYGTYHLGGEIASVMRYIYPGYCPRVKNNCGMMTKRTCLCTGYESKAASSEQELLLLVRYYVLEVYSVSTNTEYVRVKQSVREQAI